MKNILLENMLRFGTKNISKSQRETLAEQFNTPEFKQQAGGIEKQLGADVHILGKAQKAIGMIWKAIGGVGTDFLMIYKGIRLIDSQEVFNAALAIVKTDPKIKQEFGKNFNSIIEWIGMDIERYAGGFNGGIGNFLSQIVSDGLTNLDICISVEQELRRYGDKGKLNVNKYY
jgi:hypothetical protein